LRKRAQQVRQHVNPLALQHGIEAVQGALTGAQVAKVDRAGNLKIRKFGVAKAALRPSKTLRRALDGAALGDRVKAYNQQLYGAGGRSSAADAASCAPVAGPGASAGAAGQSGVPTMSSGRQLTTSHDAVQSIRQMGETMTVEELLRRGRECQAAGDLAGAEAAYREADECQDAEAAVLLGLMFKQRGDLSSAADAFRRAEARGHPEAASSLGNLMWDTGDLEGAKAAYKRSVTAGSADAGLNLGLLLAQEGAADEALSYLRSAEDKGLPEASWAVGKILEDRNDLRGAEAAYRRAAEAGDPNAAYGLGAVLIKLEDAEGARAAFQRAHDLGHGGAGQILQMLDRQSGVVPGMSTNQGSTAGSASDGSALETAVKWAQLYVTACKVVLATANECLEVANRAVGARNMAAKRPQHESSIQTFTRMAESKEQEFKPLYRTFADACAKAREIAAGFLAAQTGYDPEIVLMGNAEEDALNDVATAKAILRANFGYTPAGFIEGIRESNELLQNPFPEGGNIYTLPPSAQADERTCPWCAETIKAAAIICRFCGRDVQTRPTSPPPT
jgi:tetratricopeptide (TPR) repeat protein